MKLTRKGLQFSSVNEAMWFGVAMWVFGVAILLIAWLGS